MKQRSSNSRIYGLFVFVLCLAQAGCLSRIAARKVKIPASQQLLPAKSMTRMELLQKLEEQSNAIRTFTASAIFDAAGGGIETGEITQWRQTNASIVVDRPAQIRVIVKLPYVGTTGADMVSDGLRFHLYIPVEEKWVNGDSNAPGHDPNPVKNLRPKHILDALFVDVVAYLKNPKFVSPLKETIQGQRSYYILEFVDTGSDTPQVVEEIWFDRTDLQVARKILYTKEGKVESNIEFLNYQPADEGFAFPQVINLQHPIDHYSLKITFQKTTFNQPLPQTAFLLERPNGVKEIELAPAPVSQQP